MKNHTNSFAEKLLGQESLDSNLRADYEKRIANMVDRKIHWLPRIICALAALGGIVFSISLGTEFFRPHEKGFNIIIKSSIFLLLICVVFYTSWAAMMAIRGRSRFGSVSSIILGAIVVSGFFICLWSFLIFIFPTLFQWFQGKTEQPFMSVMVMQISTVFMFLIMGFFGVLTAGVTFILHLLCKYHGQNHRKLLEIELALAELSEKKTNPLPSN
jgi:hypothetical protein